MGNKEVKKTAMSGTAILGFIEFEKSCTKEIRGGEPIYDVGGLYKYLSLKELIKHYYTSTYKQ